MRLEYEEDATVLRAILEGEIDHHSAKAIREEIDTAAQKPGIRLVKLDFSGVTFMDSSGIGLIMGRYRLMQGLGGSLEVVRTPPHLEKLMRLAGISQLKVIKKES